MPAYVKKVLQSKAAKLNLPAVKPVTTPIQKTLRMFCLRLDRLPDENAGCLDEFCGDLIGDMTISRSCSRL